MEKRIIFATGNQNKMKEIHMILADLGMPIYSMKEAGIDIDIVEDGTTFEENAQIKAKAIAKYLPDDIILADDSGLEIDYLNKEPGIYSARYAGVDTSYDIKNQMLLDRLKGVPDEKRTALADKRNGGSSDKDALYVASREVERLDAYRQTITLEKVPDEQQFDRLKALFSADVDARAAAADKTDTELANAFAFLDAAIPDSQELVLFATELTANWFTSWFIQNFGCDAYFAHNKRLLFDDTQKQLLQDIESARNEES